MAFKGKHTVEEINGVRCTIVEKGVSANRISFLKSLLEFNKFEVVTAELPKAAETDPQSFVLGVTDLVFNPTIAVYQMVLKTPEGGVVTAPYWNQESTGSLKEYWTLAK